MVIIIEKVYAPVPESNLNQWCGVNLYIHWCQKLGDEHVISNLKLKSLISVNAVIIKICSTNVNRCLDCKIVYINAVY